MTELYPWNCTVCDASGLTTASVHDVLGEAKKHCETTGHMIFMSGWAEK